MAADTPRKVQARHITSYRPVRSRSNPPGRAPGRHPTSRLGNTTPKGAAMNLGPKIRAATAPVNGIVGG